MCSPKSPFSRLSGGEIRSIHSIYSQRMTGCTLATYGTLVPTEGYTYTMNDDFVGRWKPIGRTGDLLIEMAGNEWHPTNTTKKEASPISMTVKGLSVSLEKNCLVIYTGCKKDKWKYDIRADVDPYKTLKSVYCLEKMVCCSLRPPFLVLMTAGVAQIYERSGGTYVYTASHDFVRREALGIDCDISTDRKSILILLKMKTSETCDLRVIDLSHREMYGRRTISGRQSLIWEIHEPSHLLTTISLSP